MTEEYTIQYLTSTGRTITVTIEASSPEEAVELAYEKWALVSSLNQN